MVLIIIFSVGLYFFIKASIVDDIKAQLVKEAEYIVDKSQKIERNRNVTNLDLDLFSPDRGVNFNPINAKVVIETRKEYNKATFENLSKSGRDILVLMYPYNKKTFSYVRVQKDITSIGSLLDKILTNILIINFIAIFLIIFYAIILSKTLMTPITTLTTKLSKMNEGFLAHIDSKDLPLEFEKLGSSINKLIDRIQTFVKYQKEIFIGIAHELRTPLAVMKTKNEVTLMKPRDREKYIETIKQNVTSINDMTKMISNILEIGRKEGDQFEEPKKLELIKFLNGKIKDFKIVAESDKRNIKIISDLRPQEYVTVIQKTLLVHILQNFAQNAIKFTGDGGTVIIRAYRLGHGITIDVIDEGTGIDESKDLFAPFKRYGNKGGVGLGLFLAKGAADAIGATLSIKNREDRQGAIATVYLNSDEIN